MTCETFDIHNGLKLKQQKMYCVNFLLKKINCNVLLQLSAKETKEIKSYNIEVIDYQNSYT